MDANNLKKAFELFVKLQDKKVKLSNVDGKIKYRAPSGIMTNEVIEEIRKCKNELLTIINCTEHPEKLWKGKQGDSFPLTDVQSAYLIGRKNIFQYGNAACHIYMEVEYSELDSQRVEEVWNILINRHPMLRVIFSDTGIQKILRDTPWYTLYTNRNITYTQETLQTELGHKIYDASKWPMFDIGCVSQPHTYTRTKAFFHEFAEALSHADHLVLADIFAARETDTLGISSADLAKETEKLGTDTHYFPSFAQIEAFLKENCRPGDLLITMGAGDVVTIGENLLK